MGRVNAQELQIQCLLEFEKLKTKLSELRKKQEEARNEKEASINQTKGGKP